MPGKYDLESENNSPHKHAHCLCILNIVFSMNAMLKKNVISPEDKPIWFEIYALHPPHSEPRYDQEAPAEEIRDILYEDDIIRAYVYVKQKTYFHSIDM